MVSICATGVISCIYLCSDDSTSSGTVYVERPMRVRIYILQYHNPQM